MTREAFRDDPYRTELDTVVETVDGTDVTLVETIFCACSGGQEGDRGSIGGWPVLDARTHGRDILYTLPPGHDLSPGTPVRVEIDWPRRYRLMRLRFAVEQVLAEVCARCPGIDKIGTHIAEDEAHIDFAWPQPLTPVLPDLAARIEALVAADRPIVSAFSDEAAEQRYREVEGAARVPCGDMHLKRTGELGRIALKRRNVGKSRERIEILLAGD